MIVGVGVPGVDKRHLVDVLAQVREDLRDHLAALTTRGELEGGLQQGTHLLRKEPSELVESLEFLAVALGEFGFVVPRVNVARPAIDEQPDYARCLWREVRLARGHRI